MVYNITMKINEINTIVEDVLTDEEVASIYQLLESPTRETVVKLYAQSVVDFNLPEKIRNKIISICETLSGEEGLEIAEYQFARYKRVLDEASGEVLLPKLTPHWDDAFKEPRFTFDYQIGGNSSWPLVVEEKEFTLKNNSALTFSGTHQIHWRMPKEFGEDEHIDMVFFHLKKTGAGPYPEDWPKEMNLKMNHYENIYNEAI
jgi:hypothetical protein